MEDIPTEILADIFSFAIDRQHANGDNTDPTLTLCLVCRRWRDIVMTTGQLWTSITITLPASRQQLSRVMVFLSRSQTLPLDLLLDLRDPNWDWNEDSHVFRWQDMESILRLLLVHVERWERIELLTDTWSPIFTFLWYSRRVEAAPILKSISISRCNAYYAARGETFQPTALKTPVTLFGGIVLDKLRDVSLVGVHLNWTASRLQNLTTLEFKYHASDVMPSLDEFRNILSNCPSLFHLAIVGWGPQLGSKDGPVTQHHTIELPRLTRFSYGFVDVNYAIQLLSIFRLPLLEELMVEDVTRIVNPSDYEDSDSSPLLEWLATNRSTEPLFSEYFPLQRVNTLKMCGLRSKAKYFAYFLDEFPKVQRLGIFDCSSDVFAALIHQKNMSGRSDALPCPCLKDLECRSADPQGFVRTLLARAQVGDTGLLSRVSLTVSDDGRALMTNAEAIREELVKTNVEDIVVRVERCT